MTWSTSQLAELAGTTLKTVRHYHKIGLLDEPERSVNGYKQYEVSHLIRLLRVRRLVDLGVPLSEIPAMELDDGSAEQTLRTLDAELAASIERQQRMRDDLASVLQHRGAAGLPPGFGESAAGMSEADRSLVLVYSRVFTPADMSSLQELTRRTPSALDSELDTLPEDATEEMRQDLAERMAPELIDLYETHPWLDDLGAQAPRGEKFAHSVIGQALLDLYSPAQLDVLHRTNVIRQRDRQPDHD